MTLPKTQWASLAVCAATLLFSWAVYRDLPDTIPVHWNAAGVVDRYNSRAYGAFALPAVAFAAWLLLWALPKAAPNGWRIEPFQSVWDRLQVALLMLLAGVHALVLGTALGWWPASGGGRWAIAGVGLLLMVLGNSLGKVTRNFFFGIRTPWTLASDEVWLRTHRLGGWLLVLGGAALFAMGLVGVVPAVLIVVLVVLVVVPIAYSFVLYRRLEGFRAPQD